eukprot:12932479-Prorocentrum_lima.AAC.1
MMIWDVLGKGLLRRTKGPPGCGTSFGAGPLDLQANGWRYQNTRKYMSGGKIQSLQIMYRHAAGK